MARTLLRLLLAHFGPQRWWCDTNQFEIVAGALLVQRTTWSNAVAAIENLRQDGMLSIEAIADSSLEALGASIRPAGFYRTKAERLRGLARYIANHGGFAKLEALSTEALRRRLLEQPGVGPETADVILGYVFNRAVFVVDAYARRLFARLEAPHASPSDAELKSGIEASLRDASALKEFHALIVAHGKQYCRATPRCGTCPLLSSCRYAAQRE